MKPTFSILIAILVAVLLAGCISTSTYVKERVDLKAQGNRGYLQGTPLPSEKSTSPRTRTIINVDIELPPYEDWERYEWKDDELWGNRGYVSGRGPR